MAARLTIESTVDVGTTVIVALPAERIVKQDVTAMTAA